MIVRSSGSQPVRVEQDVVLARQTVRKLTQDCAMRLIDQIYTAAGMRPRGE